jgi:NAD(P)-dependent dehydrogenase (short-subunit alcohol dehydrogenase family)
MDDLTGKIAVVTGAGSGIGQGVALRLARAGASVFVCDVRPDITDKAAALRASGLDVTGCVADVADGDDMRRLMEIAGSAGGIDILLNNAGIGCRGTAETLSEAEWERTIDVNLKGMFLAAKHAIPYLRARRPSAIVNIGSIHAYMTQGERVAYVASKAGVLGMTRAMALNHAGDGIRVNSVSPGPIDTPELRESWQKLQPDQPIDDILAEIGGRLPSGRIGTVADVAELVAFLCGPHAGFINGTDILIDGGAHTNIGFGLT